MNKVSTKNETNRKNKISSNTKISYPGDAVMIASAI